MTQKPIEVCRSNFYDTQQYENKFRARVLELQAQIERYPDMKKKDKLENVFKHLLFFNLHLEDALRQEGFWCQAEEKDLLFKKYPFPQENMLGAIEAQSFLEKLDFVEAQTRRHRYMGHSQCRCCGMDNGTSTYVSDVYVWPEGYRHYIDAHRVMPSAGFVLFINSFCEKHNFVSKITKPEKT